MPVMQLSRNMRKCGGVGVSVSEGLGVRTSLEGDFIALSNTNTIQFIIKLKQTSKLTLTLFLIGFM